MYDSGAELYRAWLAGDGTALERLVGAYSDALVRFAYSYTGTAAVPHPRGDGSERPAPALCM